jgi:hypothetical protein
MTLELTVIKEYEIDAADGSTHLVCVDENNIQWEEEWRDSFGVGLKVKGQTETSVAWKDNGQDTMNLHDAMVVAYCEIYKEKKNNG